MLIFMQELLQNYIISKTQLYLTQYVRPFSKRFRNFKHHSIILILAFKYHHKHNQSMTL